MGHLVAGGARARPAGIPARLKTGTVYNPAAVTMASNLGCLPEAAGDEVKVTR